MARIYDGIDTRLAAWIEAQPMFFVATAPLAADGLVNLSPKGTKGTFRVLDEHTFAYLDITGSGVETIAHLAENGRICVMFCAFDGKPKIVRLHGRGRALRSGPGVRGGAGGFGAAGAERRRYLRAVINVDVRRWRTPAASRCPRWSWCRADDAGRGVAQPRRRAHRHYHGSANASSLEELPALPVRPRSDRSGGATAPRGRPAGQGRPDGAQVAAVAHRQLQRARAPRRGVVEGLGDPRAAATGSSS